jgi:hypothetical protein
LNALQWVFGSQWLGNRVAVYVPSTYNVNQVLTNEAAERVVGETARFLSQLFGGATSQTATGYYVASDGTLVTEEVTIVYSYTRRLSRNDRKAVFDYCRDLKLRLGQELVTVEVNGKLRFL